MLRKACNVLPLILIVVGHLIFLTQGVMIGWGFSSDPNPMLRLVSITSNERDLADGPAHTSREIQDEQFGTDDRQFSLRAERQADDSGRIDTITHDAEDANSNVTIRQTTVAVPHS